MSSASSQADFEQVFAQTLHYPKLTYGLIGLNIAIWCGMWLMGNPPLQSDAKMLYQLGGLTTAAVQQGDWWRMLAATFLHGGLMHLTMNMIGLYATGVMAERIYGHMQFAILYLGAAITGSAMSMHFAAQSVISVGASGAVFGLAGALLVAVLQHRDKLPTAFSNRTLLYVGIFLVYSLLQGYSKQGVDNGAHVGGMLGGMLAAYVLPEKFDMALFQRTFKRYSVLTLGVMLASSGLLAATARHAHMDPGQVLIADQQLRTAFVEYFNEMHTLEEEVRAVESGQLSEVDADQMSRAVHAPAFKQIVETLENTRVPANDPRAPLAQDILSAARLMAEWMEMNTIYDLKTGRIEAANPKRVAELQTELKIINRRIMQYARPTAH